jgi:ribulose-phosphate 3-epimerase
MNRSPWPRTAKLGGPLLAPSILSADFSRLAEEVSSVEMLGADWVHVDVMDNHFVPNLTIGAPVVASLRKATKMPLDCHLMVEKPEKLIPAFLQAGADGITVHVESTQDVRSALKLIQSGGARAGLTLRPSTPLNDLLPFLKEVDLVLIMTVEPGFSGQSFMHDQLQKIERIKTERRAQGLDFIIQVDGGVNQETAKLLRGTDCLVAGSFVFGAPDRRKALEALSFGS